MDPNNIVPVTLFLVIGASVSIMAYMAWKIRNAAQETLRAAIAAGQQLDEKTVRALAAKPSFTPEADLRVGIQGVATGIGIIVAASFGRLVAFDEEFSTILTIVGIVVTFVGAGNLLSWKIRSKLPNSEGF